MSTKKKVVGQLKLRFGDKGNYDRRTLATFFSSDYTGNYGVKLAFATGEKDENGYPVEEEVVAVKLANGDKVDVTEAFAYFIAYAEMAERPPREEQ